MAELLGCILEPILEAILEVVLGGLIAAALDLASRLAGHLFEALETLSVAPAFINHVVLGAVMGGLSLLVLPHPLVQPSRIHGLNLCISPIAAGLTMLFVRLAVQRMDRHAVRIVSFTYGFAFAWGVALVRFFFVG